MPQLFDTLTTEALYLRDKLTGAKKRARRAAFSAFDQALAQLGPRDLAIDLGANIGDFTERFAATGADVIAFEPDPHAHDMLTARCGTHRNVTILQAAAGVEAGTLQLYRRTGFDTAPDKASSSSSMFAEKRKMDPQNAVNVEVIDFPAFLAGLDRDIAILKIDIEGAEVPLMEALVDHPALARISHIFIESHERVVRSLAARTRALKAKTAGRTQPVINWDWH